MNQKTSILLVCLFIISTAPPLNYEYAFAQESLPEEDILFQDDFEKGNINDWALGAEWSIEEEDGNHVLNMQGGRGQSLGDQLWIDYSFQSKVKLVQDGFLLLFRVNYRLRGSYLINLGLDHVNLNREVMGKGEALADADIALQPNEWYIIRIEGRRNNIKILIGGELTINYTDNSELAILYGRIGFETFQSSHIQIDDVLVIDIHGAPVCNMQEGEPIVQYGYIVEAEEAVGQWQTTPLQVGERERLGRQIQVFANAAYTNQLCPNAVSSVRFHVPNTGYYYIFGKIQGIEKFWGKHETFLVDLYDSDGKLIPNLIDIEHETNFFGNLGRWYLQEGNVTLTFKAKTDHLIVIDYFTLHPELKADNRSFVILPVYPWSAEGGWIGREGALSTSTTNATSWIDISVPFQGNYSIYVDLWYSNPTSLTFELGDVEELMHFKTPLSGEELFWTTVKIGDFPLEKGDILLKFTSGDLGSSGVIEITSFLIFSKEMPVNKAPTADFIYIPSSPTILSKMRFIDRSLDADGAITKWLWSFGDGTNSTEQNPFHNYTEIGTYTVTLLVTDDNGDSNETSKTIEIKPDPPPTLTTTTTAATKKDEPVSRFPYEFYTMILLAVAVSILIAYLIRGKRST